MNHYSINYITSKPQNSHYRKVFTDPPPREPVAELTVSAEHILGTTGLDSGLCDGESGFDFRQDRFKFISSTVSSIMAVEMVDLHSSKYRNSARMRKETGNCN